MSLPAMAVNKALMLLPSSVMAAMQTRAIKPTSSPYSTSEAAFTPCAEFFQRRLQFDEHQHEPSPFGMKQQTLREFILGKRQEADLIKAPIP